LAVATEVEGDHLVSRRKDRELELPITDAGAQAVDEQERFPLAGYFIVQANVADVQDRHKYL
jgi:hypothetical protein